MYDLVVRKNIKFGLLVRASCTHPHDKSCRGQKTTLIYFNGQQTRKITFNNFLWRTNRLQQELGHVSRTCN